MTSYSSSVILYRKGYLGRPSDWQSYLRRCCWYPLFLLTSLLMLLAFLLMLVRSCDVLFASLVAAKSSIANVISAVDVSWVPAIIVVYAVAGVHVVAGAPTVANNPSANCVSLSSGVFVVVGIPVCSSCLLCCCHPAVVDVLTAIDVSEKYHSRADQ